MVSSAFQDTIKKYLDDFVVANPEFKGKYENPNKSISGCCEFICSEVEKMGVNGLSDEEVYGLAVHYYQEDNLKVSNDNKSCQVVVNHHIDLTEEEKKKLKEKAEEEYKQQIIDEEKKKAERQKAKETKKQEQSNQMLLF